MLIESSQFCLWWYLDVPLRIQLGVAISLGQIHHQCNSGAMQKINLLPTAITQKEASKTDPSFASRYLNQMLEVQWKNIFLMYNFLVQIF